MKDKLHRFIRDDRTYIGILILIIINIVVMVVDVAFPEGTVKNICEGASTTLTLIFVLELLIRWYVADSFRSFVKDCWIEIIAVIPVARTFRILRLVRLMRLISWGLRARRQHRFQSFGAFLSENIALIVVPIVVVIGAAIAILNFESRKGSFSTPLGSFFWSLSTLMAGEPIYGEPTTIGGKVVTTLLMFAGFTFFAFFTGFVSTYMMKRLRDDITVDSNLLSSLKDHYIICGWNRAAPRLIEELRSAEESRKRDIVIVADKKPNYEMKPRLNNGDLLFVQGDYTTGELLEEVGVTTARSAIFLAGRDTARSDRDHDARTVLAALTAEKMNAASPHSEQGNNIYSCVELLDRDEDKMYVLESAHVEDVLEGHEFMGHLIAHSISVDGLLFILDNLLTSKWGAEFKIYHADRDGTFHDLLGLYKREKGFIIVGVYDTDGLKRFVINPFSEAQIVKGTALLVISSSKSGCRPLSECNTDDEIIFEEDGSLQCTQSGGNHILVCGWNRAVPRIIKELRNNVETAGCPIKLIAECKELPESLLRYIDEGILEFLEGDCMSPTMLKRAGVTTASAAIIAANSLDPMRTDQDRDARSVLTALTIEKHNPSIKTCVELLNREEHKIDILQKANVEMVISRDYYLGSLIAQSTITPGLAMALNELLTANHGCEFKRELYKSSTPSIFSDLLVNHFDKTGRIIVGVRRMTARGIYEYRANPCRDDNIQYGDELYTIVTNEA